MASLQACPAECAGGLVFIPSAQDLQKVFVDETLWHYRHHEIAALPVGEPNLPAETPDSVKVGEHGHVLAVHRSCCR